MMPRWALPVVIALALGASVSAHAATIQITMENLVISPAEATATPTATAATGNVTSFVIVIVMVVLRRFRRLGLSVAALTRQADKLQAIADKAWGNRAGANKPLVQVFQLTLLPSKLSSKLSCQAPRAVALAATAGCSGTAAMVARGSTARRAAMARTSRSAMRPAARPAARFS